MATIIHYQVKNTAWTFLGIVNVVVVVVVLVALRLRDADAARGDRVDECLGTSPQTKLGSLGYIFL